MGKKILSQVKVKISKTADGEKKQLNSLIKVLRPKVYITDSSSFKSLVQELTGNGRTVLSSQLPSHSHSPSPSPSSSSSLHQIVDDELVPVIEVEDDPGNPESSLESSFDASLETSFQVCNPLALGAAEGYDPLPFDETNSSEYIFKNQHEDSFVYGDLQALLLNFDEQYCPNSFNVYSQIQPEVSIYDYELSGLI